MFILVPVTMLPVPHHNGVFKLNYSESSFITCSSYGKNTPSSIIFTKDENQPDDFIFQRETITMEEKYGLTQAEQLKATFSNIVENPTCADIQERNSDRYKCTSSNTGLEDVTSETSNFAIEITRKFALFYL